MRNPVDFQRMEIQRAVRNKDCRLITQSVPLAEAAVYDVQHACAAEVNRREIANPVRVEQFITVQIQCDALP